MPPNVISMKDYALQKALEKQSEFEFDGKRYDLQGLDRHEIANAYKELRLKIKQSYSSDDEMLDTFDRFSEYLETISGCSIFEILENDEHSAIATWQMIQSAASNEVTIGSHSVDHFRLACIPCEDVDHQLVHSRKVLEEQTGRECKYFCYPDGSLDDFVKSRTAAAGYRAAISSEAGNNTVGEDLFQLRRYPFPNEDIHPAYLLQISGLSRARFSRFFKKIF